MLALRERRHEDALNLFPQDFEGLSDKADRLQLRLMWGNALLGAGRNREAREHYLAIYRDCRHTTSDEMRDTGLKALMNAGLATCNLGDTGAAIQFYRAVLSRELASQPLQELKIRNLLGSLHVRRGELDQAALELKRALELALETQEAASEADVRLNLAALAFHAGNLEEATGQMEQSRKLAADDPVRRLRVELNMGTLLVDQGLWDKAWIFFDKAQDIARRRDLKRYLPLILANQARIRQREGLMVEAVKLAREALSLADSLEQQDDWVRRCCREVLDEEGDATRSDDFDLAAALITQHDMVAASSSMQRVLRDVEALASSDLPVLVLGETGTGKELVARALHAAGHRKDAPFVPVNCPAIPEPLFESTLFGHVKGAFTGADQDRPGLVELAGQGSLFLDEIGDLPVSIQPKLLRFLESGEYQRMGSGEVRYSSARIISATNRDLEDLGRARQFREDLIMRISAFRIDLPPLRERRDDLYFIASSLVEKLNRQHGMRKVLSGNAFHLLDAYPFPGNVRELKNAVLRGYQTAAREIEAEDLGLRISGKLPALSLQAAADSTVQKTVDKDPEGWVGGLLARLKTSETGNLEEVMADLEERLIRQALAHRQGDREKTAEDLGLSYRALKYKITKYGIKSRKGKSLPPAAASGDEGKDLR